MRLAARLTPDSLILAWSVEPLAVHALTTLCPRDGKRWTVQGATLYPVAMPNAVRAGMLHGRSPLRPEAASLVIVECAEGRGF